MSITMPMLLDVLTPLGLIQRGHPWQEGNFDTIKLFSSNIVEYQSTTLYVASGEELERFYQIRRLRPGQHFCVVCLADGSGEFIPQDDGITVLLIPNTFHFAYVFNHISDLFSDFDHWIKEIDRVSYSGGTLKQLLDLGRKWFGNPVLVWDATFNFSAVSAEQPISNSAVQNMLDKNYFSGEIVQNILANGLLAVKEEYEGKIRFISRKETLCGESFYMQHFFEKEHRTFSVCVIALDRDLTPGQEAQLPCFFGKVADFLNRQQYTKKSGYHYIYESFLTKLMTGEVTDAWEIESRAAPFGLPFKRDYLFYAIDFEKFSQPQADFLIYSLRQTLPNERFIVYEKRVCLLKSVDAYSCDKEGPRQRFDKLLRSYNAYCGLSRVFHDLTQCHTAFLQASTALRLGMRLDAEESGDDMATHIFRYRDYAVYHMLEICEEQVDIFSLLPKRLVRFCREDLKNGGGDVELLSVYMCNGMSASATARAMFLHRNSVTYRIKRIEEQCNLNLTENESIFNVLLLLKALRYHKKIPG